MSNRRDNERAANRARRTELKSPVHTQAAESARADARRHDNRALRGQHGNCSAPRCTGCGS